MILLKNVFGPVLLLILLFSALCLTAAGQRQTAREQRLADRALRRFGDITGLLEGWNHVGEMQIDSVMVNRDDNIISVYFNPPVTHIPVRYPWLESLRARLINRLGFRFRDYELLFYSRGRLLEEYIPNYYRVPYMETDSARMAQAKGNRQIVRNAGKPCFKGGLSGSHIALWPSHGYYYEAELDRWEWQRARLYGTIEDLYPFSFIEPYLLPMLENSGAYVMLPRERDLQSAEVIVDYDGSTGESELITVDGEMNKWEIIDGSGFAAADTLFEGDNPFTAGSHMRIKAGEEQGAEIIYIPDIPADGKYAVYVSWADSPVNISGVRCTLNYGGGNSVFYLDQTMGWGTWIYIGTYHFLKGMDSTAGSLTISNDSGEAGYITADAVRFGGGKGNVARKPAGNYLPRQRSLRNGGQGGNDGQVLYQFHEPEWKLSGRPRYMEAARYYLQYSGMPDSTVYSINEGKNDYNDDYMSRGEWVNYLTGAPMTVTGKPDPGSPLIPVDLAMAFHTDAGVTSNDSVIGTLAIYSSERTGGMFHNGQSRLAARDMSDIIQTQIVHDIRLHFNDQWTRRGIWDREYSEAWRPHVPSLLLELLSHQNLADMGYGLDPGFKFIVSRSIYKGILRYLAFEQGRDAVIQPLPPEGMALEKAGEGTVRLRWMAREDPLEPSAVPDSYRVYTRRENAGFDGGVTTDTNFIDIRLPEKGIIYGFRVTALNEGGESMPGEILSACLSEDNDKPVLVVNAFTRVSGPAVFDQGSMAGVAWWDDYGVADRYDFSHTGVQYDFDRSSDWLDDDSPGWGASYADMENKIIPGNTFDFPALYGRALKDAGYSFISVSRKAFEQSHYSTLNHPALILIFGEQLGSGHGDGRPVSDFRVFSPGMIDAVESFAAEGGNIFLSGAYIGTDMVVNNDSTAIDFAREVLGFTWRTNHADNVGKVVATDMFLSSFPDELFFNSSYHTGVYSVEAPDAIEPAGENSFSIYRYGSNNASAGVIMTGRHKVLALGFPFETVLEEGLRMDLIKKIMSFFESDTPFNNNLQTN